MEKTTIKKLFVLAGEASGDDLGAAILTQLRLSMPHVKILGIGGKKMEKAGGFSSLIPIERLAVSGWKACFGLHFVLYILKRILRKENVWGLLTIDSVELSLRLGKALKNFKSNRPHRFHVVAPSVWAWRPGRARKVLTCATDHLMVLFPFEKDYFFPKERCHFVGHPLANQRRSLPEKGKNVWMKKISLASGEGLEKSKLLTFFPGSRWMEIRYAWPLFQKVILVLLQKYPHMNFCIVAPGNSGSIIQYFEKEVKKFCQTIGDPLKKKKIFLIYRQNEKRSILATTHLAIATNGSVSLEIARHNVPMIVGYRLPRFLAWVVKKMIRIPWVCLVNILKKQSVVPELLQQKWALEPLLNAIEEYLGQPEKMHRQVQSFQNLWKPLRGNPSFEKAVVKIVQSVEAKEKEVCLGRF